MMKSYNEGENGKCERQYQAEGRQIPRKGDIRNKYVYIIEG